MIIRLQFLLIAVLATIYILGVTGTTGAASRLSITSKLQISYQRSNMRYAAQVPILLSITKSSTPLSSILHSIRGGDLSPYSISISDDDGISQQQQDDDEDRQKRKEEYQKLLKYRTEQQLLYQLRSTYLSEILASRGVPNLPTLTSVQTPDNAKLPTKVDWDCALSTIDEPKSCLYSFDAEVNTKVISPINTKQYISLIALNRLRRTDPTKVEPMWHSQYSILNSWFSDSSEYSILQHVGLKGYIISSILLDGMNGMVLRTLLICSILSVLIVCMPLIEYAVQRIIVSAPFWNKWSTWGRIARAGFPLKLLIGQLVWKGVASAFCKVENEVREYIVDMECDILEESVPVTVGVGSEEYLENGEDDDDDEYDDTAMVDDGDDYYDDEYDY